MATIRLLLDTRTEKKNNTYPVKLSLFHQKKTSYIGLDISVKENQWDEDNREIKDHPKSKKYNEVIRLKSIQTESLLLSLSAANRLSKLSHKELLSMIIHNNINIEPEPEREYLISDHFKKFIDNKSNARTKAIYQETLDKVLKFSPRSTFNEVNLSWLRSFDIHLAKTCKTNTRSIHMRNIRAVFNDAINEDLVNLNLYPFRKFKIKSERTIKRTLSIAQIKQLRDYPVQEHQERYRDLFMLIFYLIGINLVDLLRLRHDDLRNGRIEYIRAKTGRPYSIEVLPEAMAIIEKYKGKDFLLNVSDDYHNYKDFAARMNENLKEIGVLEWIPNKAKKETDIKKNKKKITPLFPELIVYTARRSWATAASSLDIPKDTISEALGHEIGSRTTSLYVNFDLKKVDKANRDVLAAISSQS